MKNSVKKIFLALCAASVLLMSATAFATPTTEPSAPRSVSASSGTVSSGETEPASDDTTSPSDDGSTDGVVQGDTRPVPTAISTGQAQQPSVVQNTEAQRAAEKTYASKGMMFLWFFFAVIINAIISFVIGNRFYKLAKKDNHVSSEIRALRRDLEEKFVSNVGGFNEMETDVANTNDNYSMNGSIKMPERKSADFASESEDVFKRWESQMSQKRRKPAAPEPVEQEFFDDDEEEVKRPKKKFQPSRRKPAPVEEYDDEIEEEYDDIPESESKVDSVKSKAKNLLGDIFPFKED